jgi:hypothetical protein
MTPANQSNKDPDRGLDLTVSQLCLDRLMGMGAGNCVLVLKVFGDSAIDKQLLHSIMPESRLLTV